MVEVDEFENKKEKGKFKGPAFEIQEYEFSEVQEASSDKFKSKADLYGRYKKDKEISLKEFSKPYSKVRNISSKEVSLVTVKDHTTHTLNLAIATRDKIVEMRLNLKAIQCLI